ncbi:PLP-dependent aminotransferase family protein [Steroidobacter sp.]|uniref:MocR-like pyridoxine biosynthesis transcription factor PdxR n=1 Tax=Steroidobacter sp. TaxID=1978227 RepID=UPI001A3688B2|nr:PLP-dependent aminotransferase family protein [Steroidobacter sp.]MBL8271539.1 PLP-dependent aminotransferase family protein [Steroidobacter sp.]
MEPVLELPIRIPPRKSGERLRALHGQLKAAILEGRLRPGLRLPATRVLATNYGVSRNTAIATYDLLLSEGYITTRHGAGTYVSDVLPRMTSLAGQPRASAKRVRQLHEFWQRPTMFDESPGDASVRYRFSLGKPDISQFPMSVWRRLSARALRSFARAPLSDEAPAGRPALREAIAKHVSFARAVACNASDIVVTSGAQQAFDLLARMLVTAKRAVVAMEDPGYPRARMAFSAAGAKIVPVAVDEEGLIVEQLPANAKIIYVTPSHQFPTGAVMSPRRRAELLAFADAHDALIVEDDYDAEFRFGARPLDALQTLDRTGSVFYVGTFSKSLFPDLRLGFVVAPAWAQPSLIAAKQCSDGQCSPLLQETLASFIAEGHLARHVRRMRQVYSGRREALLDGLKKHLSKHLTPVPSAAGLHLAAFTQASVNVEKIVEQARRHGAGVYPLRRFQSGRSARAGLVFGFSSLTEREITEGLVRLAKAFNSKG